MSLLDVDSLTVRYPGQPRPAIEELCFSLGAGESVALAGASGSGKTQTALALLGLLPAEAGVEGRVLFDGTDMAAAPESERRKRRARGIAMVFQDPSSALNPHLRIGEQLRLILEQHGIARRREAWTRAVAMLERCGLPEPGRQARAFPWQLSGGMRQRAMIASALIAGPSLLVADEPTTALDTTVQAQILALLASLKTETGIGLLLITHDFGVIANSTERLLVLHEGRLIERGPTADVIAGPSQEQTARMLEASRSESILAGSDVKPAPVLEARGLCVVYRERPTGRIWRQQEINALRPADFALRGGETLGIVGESGSGKTSLVRALLGLLDPEAGSVSFLGKTLPASLRRRNRADLSGLQLVFQDPVGSLDPAWRVGEAVGEPLRVHAPSLNAHARAERVDEALRRVGLPAALSRRYPHQLSGGQAQRAAIARALILHPQVLICDEAVAALDGPVRQEILELLAREQRDEGLSILFISHDLSVVRRLSHRVMVMYMGRVVESGASDRLFARPRHPYTRALLDAALPIDAPSRRTTPVEGELPSMLDAPRGCAFHPRCAHAQAECRAETPALREVDGMEVACLRAEELDLSRAG